MERQQLTLTLTLRLVAPLFLPGSDGRKEGHHYAQHGLTIGVIWAVTLVLSNLSSDYPQESGRIMRNRTFSLSHLRRMEGSTRLIFHNYPRVRAQGLITPRPDQPVTYSMLLPGVGCTWYTQGGTGCT